MYVDLLIEGRGIVATVLGASRVGPLQGTGLDDSGALAILDVATLRAGGLESLDNVQRSLVGHLAEDDVPTVEPRGNDRGNEELGTVAIECQLRVENTGASRVPAAGRPHVLGPALAMDNKPGLSCFSWKFSSANFSP